MAATPPVPATPSAPEQAGADPSMEDILASIRRILNEDEAGAATADAKPVAAGSTEAASVAAETDEDEVVVLDQSMIVARAAEPAPTPPEDVALITPPASPPPNPASAGTTPGVPLEVPRASDLLAPESEAAAVSSVGSLLRLLTAERTTQVHRGGPTIEDLVREEIRPLLKTWLDTHLPPLVERLVRVEIERVTGRAGSG